jgi:fumarate reductase flavoprotein subunit
VRAAELGLRVAVLEKGTTPDYLCNSRISGGVFHVAHEDVTKPAETILAAIEHTTQGNADPRLARALAEEVGPAMAWLGGLGGKFIRSGAQARHTLMAAPPRPLGDMLDWMTSWQGRGPDQLIRLLAQRLAEFGGVLLLGHRAQSLVMENGACVGVDVVVGGENQRLTAQAVVVADGGFQADTELLRQHISPAPQSIRQRNAQTGTRDGLRMAEAAGAALTPMEGFYGHVLSRDAMENALLWPYPLLDDLATAGIVVDNQGNRFCDEGNGGVAIANGIAAQSDPLATTVICDAVIWERSSHKPHVSAPNPKLQQLGGTIHVAETIEALAKLAGLPEATLRAAVDKHNTACATGDFTAITPARTATRREPLPITTGPFYALPACAGITFTMGGIKIDEKARVLDTQGKPIVGLYAAGSSTGGLEGGPSVAYVSGLSKAATFGKVAAETIAARLDKPTTPEALPALAKGRPHPALDLLVKNGDWLALVIGLAPVAGGVGLAAATSGIGMQLALVVGGILIGALGGLMFRSYVELIHVIMDTLLPQE